MQNKKNVLLIMSALFVGGAEKQYRYIMEALSESNSIDVLLLNKPLKGEEQKTGNYIDNHRNIRFHQLNGDALNEAKKGKLHGIIGKIRSLGIQWMWLRKHLKNNRTDVVMYTYITQLMMTSIFRKYGVKTIFNERNTGRQICDKKFKVLLLKKCDKVICNSEYASKYINHKTGITAEVYKNGIELKSCQKKEHNEFNILVPARISQIKNQMLVVKALELLKTMLDAKAYESIHCVFAGSCEFEDYRQKILHEIKTEELNIELAGYVGNMEERYSVTDLVILPSFEEGTPNVLLEAYMYRILPLISNIPMNKACCIDDRIMFDPNDAKSLAEKIKAVISGRLLDTVDFKDKARKYVEENYSLKAMADNYERLFESL